MHKHEANDIKQFLLDWIIKHGTSDVTHYEIIGSDILSSKPDLVAYSFCTDTGMLDEVKDPITKVYYTRITEKGLEYVSMQ